jgi:hypothetical protein
MTISEGKMDLAFTTGRTIVVAHKAQLSRLVKSAEPIIYRSDDILERIKSVIYTAKRGILGRSVDHRD